MRASRWRYISDFACGVSVEGGTQQVAFGMLRISTNWRSSSSSPQPDPQRLNLLAPKVKEQHHHDTSGHAGEIESATGVEMMHISQSLSWPVAAYRATVGVHTGGILTGTTGDLN